MNKSCWTAAAPTAFLLCLGLAATARAQAPAAPATADAADAPAAAPLIPRGTATTAMPTLPPASSTLDVVRRRGVLRVGVSTFVPWATRSKDGTLIGFEVDVAKQLAADLGVDVELVPAAQANLLDDLLLDRFDVIVSGLAITPARALVVNFSIPVAESCVRLVANREKAGTIKTVAGFDRPEVTIGVRGGAFGEEVAARTFPKAKLQRFDDEDAALEALLTGKVTAFVARSPAPEFLLAKAGDKVFLPLADPLARSREAIAVRKGDPDFLSFLDTWIRCQQDSGWLTEKRKYWFEGFAWENQL
jgi:polar amino acid transport system substrate-binding protein